jgi:hypothetical protein
MPHFTKTIEAYQFIANEKEKESLDKGEELYPGKGLEIRKDGDDFIALVIVNHEQKKVNEGDYIIEANGVPVEVVAKESFEAVYVPVIEIEAPEAPEVPESNS